MGQVFALLGLLLQPSEQQSNSEPPLPFETGYVQIVTRVDAQAIECLRRSSGPSFETLAEALCDPGIQPLAPAGSFGVNTVEQAISLGFATEGATPPTAPEVLGKLGFVDKA